MTHRFSVWAPERSSVDVVIEGDRHGMQPAGGGWWEADVEGAGPGTRYSFSLDGGDPRPDPRSPFQPEGVHGPSEVVDHGAFGWTDGRWRGVPLQGAVVYELHVGTFTPAGTFDGVIGKLPYLRDLGVDFVELMPVAEFPGTRGWGYDGVDLFAPHHAYGGPDGLKRLVDAAHAEGIGVLVDVVYNHLGPAGNYLAEFGPYFTDRYATPWGQAVNLDGPGSDEVRRYFVDNALMWLRDYHADGLRLDAVHAIVDTSALHLLEELAIEVGALSGQLRRTLVLVAESDLNDPRVVARREVGGYGLDGQWSDDFHHALHAALTGETSGYYADFGSVDHIAVALERAFVHAGEHAAHRGRRHGRRPAGIPAWRFLGYFQNHDQVGNRAVGERSAALMPAERLKIGAALVLLSPFTPMLFMGEEWAASTPFQYFTDHEDADLARAVSEGRRREFASFGWLPEDVPDPQEPATFERSCLRWEESAEPAHTDLLLWHRALLRLRRTRPELVRGEFPSVEVVGCGALVVSYGDLVVAANLGPDPVAVDLGHRRVLLSAPAGLGAEGVPVAELPPDGVIVAG